MAIEIREAKTGSDLKTFVKLPFTVYRGNPYWVPPIIKDEWKGLQPQHNPAFKHCDAAFWIALKDGKAVGRIGAIINHAYNEKTGDKTGRFSRLEAIDDFEVFERLLSTAEKWLKEKGMTQVHGPLGFSNLDLQGMLVEGFDHLPSIASVYHLPYYKEHLEKLGYEKEIDWVEFRLTIRDIPEKALKMNELIKQRYGLKVLSFETTKELQPWGEKIFRVLNRAFAELFSVVAFDDELIRYYSDRYMKLLNPKYVKIILGNDGEVAGFIVALPSLSEAFQKAGGKLFPFGFRHILKAMKRPQVIDLLLTGIEPQFQSKGYSAILITELQKVLIANGIKYSETTGIFETNNEAINHWKSYEHIQHKRKRCFRKTL
jgi:GNAT superfamily N-acetyltransferase